MNYNIKIIFSKKEMKLRDCALIYLPGRRLNILFSSYFFFIIFLVDKLLFRRYRGHKLPGGQNLTMT